MKGCDIVSMCQPWLGANQRLRKEAVETEACSFQVLLTTHTIKQLRVDSAERTLSETHRRWGHRAGYFQLSYPQRSTEPISPNQPCSVSWTSFCSKDILNRTAQKERINSLISYLPAVGQKKKNNLFNFAPIGSLTAAPRPDMTSRAPVFVQIEFSLSYKFFLFWICFMDCHESQIAPHGRLQIRAWYSGHRK